MKHFVLSRSNTDGKLDYYASMVQEGRAMYGVTESDLAYYLDPGDFRKAIALDVNEQFLDEDGFYWKRAI